MAIKRKMLDAIRQIRSRKVNTIIQQIHNNIDHLLITPIIKSIIERNISDMIKSNFSISTLSDLPENEVDKCIILIRQYRFLYFDQYYG